LAESFTSKSTHAQDTVLAFHHQGELMKKISVSVAAGVLALGGLSTFAGPASAATTYDPNVARVANPANVCKSIPGSIAADAQLLGMPIPDLSWFSYTKCVTTLAKGDAVVEPVDVFGDPYKQCDVVGVTYPSTLHSGEGGEEDIFLPDLTVKNRKECGSALYAFHAIFTSLFGAEPV